MAKLKPDYINWVLTLNATQAQEEFHKLEKTNKELQKQTSASRKAMAELEAQGKKGSTEWNNLRNSIDQNSRSMAQNRAKMDEVAKRFDLTSMSVNQLKKRLKELKREFNSTSEATNPKRYKELQKEINETQQTLYRATGQTNKLKNSLLSLSKTKQILIGFFATVGMTVLTLITGSFRNAFNLIVDFEKANSKLASVLGTTRREIKELTADARQLGATTSYTAADVTRLQIELAKLGFSKEQILRMERAVLSFAKAVDTDLDRAAAFAGAALRIFNKDVSETEDVLATFAVATTKTALDFAKLEASLSTVGPVAYSFGLSIEDTTALLGMLANAGFDASSAATATRNIILNLCDANGDLAKALGTPATNAEELAKGLLKLKAEGIDLNKVLELTDKRSAAAFSVFLDKAEDINDLRVSITDVTGDFRRMSDTMGDNVAGAMAGLASASEELVLKLSSGTNGPIKDLINALTWLVQTIGAAYQWVSKFGTLIKGAIAGFALYKLAIFLANREVKLYFASLRAGSAIVAAMRAGTLLLIALFKLLTGNVKAATVALRGMKIALTSTGVGAVIVAFGALCSYLVELKSKYDEASKSIDHFAEASKEGSKLYGEQKGKIESLIMVADNENISLNRRKKAVDELNRIIPEYNAKIDKTTEKYTASKEALEKYLDLLDKEMRFKANNDKLYELAAAAEQARDAYDEAIIAAEKASDKKNFEWQSSPKERAMKLRREAKAEWDKAEADYQAFKTRMQEAMNKSIIVPPDGEETVPDVINKAETEGAKLVKRLREINAELRALRKKSPESDSEYNRIQARISALQQEKKLIEQKKGIHREIGTYREDSIDRVTAPVDDLHQKRMLGINKKRIDMSGTDYTIAQASETIRYCEELNTALASLRKETDKTHTETLDKITARENEIAAEIQTATDAINKATVTKQAEVHNQLMQIAAVAADTETERIRKAIADREIAEEAGNIYILNRQKQMHREQLDELWDYYNQVNKSDIISVDDKRKTLEALMAEIRQTQSTILTETGKYSEKVRELMSDTTSADGIKQSFELRRKALEMEYEAVLKDEKLSSDQHVALEEEKQRRIAALNFQYQEQVWQLQELTGLSWGQEYDRELAQLENYHRQGLIKEKDYQKARNILQANNAKKYFDYYSQLAGSTFSAMQEAEIAKSDAKFDVLIQQAKNNGQDTAALEEEKENKKLEIQKKYADVNFAIKVSQIIADTAVGVIKTFAEFGYTPWGIAAAALMSATGAAQAISAKAERDKIKNMQPGRASSSSSESSAGTPTASRILSGYSDGGYTGDGKRYEVAGVVHRGEYVVPMPIMDNPRVIDAVGTIEAIRRNKILGAGIPVGTPSAGYADGGYTSAGPGSNTSELSTAVRELREAVKNIRAYVVLKDIENAQDKMDRARAPFTRKR